MDIWDNDRLQKSATIQRYLMIVTLCFRAQKALLQGHIHSLFPDVFREITFILICPIGQLYEVFHSPQNRTLLANE